MLGFPYPGNESGLSSYPNRHQVVRTGNRVNFNIFKFQSNGSIVSVYFIENFSGNVVISGDLCLISGVSPNVRQPMVLELVESEVVAAWLVLNRSRVCGPSPWLIKQLLEIR